MKLGALDLSKMSDKELDAAYAEAYALKDSSTYTAIGVEIGHRQGTILGWLKNIGGSQFPQYDAIKAKQGYFVASQDAPQGIQTSAGNIVTTAGDIVTDAGSSFASIGKWGVVGLSAAAILVLAFMFRKK